MDALHALEMQVQSLERRVLDFKRLVALAGFAVLVCVIASVVLWAQDSQVLRIRGLVIEDAAGRDRIVLGAPLPDPQGRVSPATGLVINDDEGAERFAVGLLENRRLVMGFDAPPGTGDPRNRERITIVADDDGGAYIRFLNRKTGVSGRLILAADDRMYLEFLDARDGKTTIKRIGFAGEQLLDAQ
jgi:hypothetical protein